MRMWKIILPALFLAFPVMSEESTIDHVRRENAEAAQASRERIAAAEAADQERQRQEQRDRDAADARARTVSPDNRVSAPPPVATTQTATPTTAPATEADNAVANAQARARAARQREMSLANRMLGGTTMAATGMGGWMWAEGRAQQRVDDRWNDEITAIYASMFCRDGGRATPQVEAGTGAMAPMITVNLVELRYEYMITQADTRLLKAELGLPPGIEAVDIIDTSHLYAGAAAYFTGNFNLDTVAERIEAGDAARRANIGMGVAIGGAAAGIAGDAIINRTVMGFGTPREGGIGEGHRDQFDPTRDWNEAIGRGVRTAGQGIGTGVQAGAQAIGGMFNRGE